MKTSLLIAILSIVCIMGCSADNKSTIPEQTTTSLGQPTIPTISGALYFVENGTSSLKRADVLTKEIVKIVEYREVDGKLTALTSVAVNEPEGSAYIGAAQNSKLARVDIKKGMSEIVLTDGINLNAIRLIPDSTFAYAGDSISGDLLEIDLKAGTKSVIKNFKLTPDEIHSLGDFDIANGNVIADVRGFELYDFSPATGTIEKLLSHGCSQTDSGQISFIRGLKVNKKQTYVYLLCAPNNVDETEIIKLNLQSLEMITVAQVPDFCSRMDISNDENTIYTTCYSGKDGKIYKVDTVKATAEEWLSGLLSPIGIDLVE